jgi:thiamine transport system ATP-binding protein
LLALADLSVDYPDWRACYSLTVPKGALCALIGPSGGGKTTLLHLIAGFGRASSGTLSFERQDLLPLVPAARPLSILFQEHNLFPHLTAAENVGLGLDPSLRLSPAQRAEIEDALARVELAGLGNRRPGELSGGQRQRVAIARALVRRKPLMLLDEPFSGLDPGLRLDMIALVAALRQENRLTVLMAIHTPAEAAAVADMMAFVDEGRVLAAGPPARILASGGHPALDRYFRHASNGTPTAILRNSSRL